MKTFNLIIAFFTVIITFSCSQEPVKKYILVKNSTDIKRNFETVELTKNLLGVESLSTIGIKDLETEKLLVTQLVDTDGDGILDQLLFQPSIDENTERKYEIVVIPESEKPESIDYCYSRFVPERTDDYTWENDKVAFRVYGPTAQKMIEENIPGGTLSSGVDAWLKKVDYPIINKWYKETVIDKTGSYHEDTGEGLDNFHVGVSRGVGGIAAKAHNNFYFSKNYIEYKTITTGPIRTSFYLKYADWDANGNLIKESKIISLDYGNNFSKFDLTIEGIDKIYAGLTLHENDGEVTGNTANGWVSYWQPHAASELGTAIVAKNDVFQDFEKLESEEKDLSNAYAALNVQNKKLVYYAGFSWKESNQYKTKAEWEEYLNIFSKKINTPLIIEILK